MRKERQLRAMACGLAAFAAASVAKDGRAATSIDEAHAIVAKLATEEKLLVSDPKLR